MNFFNYWKIYLFFDEKVSKAIINHIERLETTIKCQKGLIATLETYKKEAKEVMISQDELIKKLEEVVEGLEYEREVK